MSDYLSFAGERLTTVSSVMPMYGAWVADVVLASGVSLPSVAAPLVIGDLTLTGTVFRGAVFAGARSARVVAGMGGWRNHVPAQDYRGASVLASTVLRDAATAVGERVLMDAQDTNLRRFVREAGPAARVLRQVAGASWWTANDGTTHIGPRPTSTVKKDFTVLSWSGRVGKFEIATEAVAEWVPGAKFDAPGDGMQTISSVMIESSNEGKLRIGVLIS